MSTQALAVSSTGTSRQQATPGTSTSREPILVVEADAHFGRALVEQLAADGHPAQLSRSAGHAAMTAGARPPRLSCSATSTRRGAPSTCWKPSAGTTRKPPGDRQPLRGHGTSR